MGSLSFTLDLETVRPKTITDQELREAHRAVWSLLFERIVNHAIAPPREDLLAYLGNVGDDGYAGRFSWSASGLHFFWKDYGGSAERSMVALEHWIDLAAMMEAPAIQRAVGRLGLAWRPRRTMYEVRSARSVLAQCHTYDSATRTSTFELWAFNDEPEEEKIIAWTDEVTRTWADLDEPTRGAIREVRAGGRCNCSMCNTIDCDPVKWRALPPDELAAVDAWREAVERAPKEARTEVIVGGLSSPFATLRQMAAASLPRNFLKAATPATLDYLRGLVGSPDVEVARAAIAKLGGIMIVTSEGAVTVTSHVVSSASSLRARRVSTTWSGASAVSSTLG